MPAAICPPQDELSAFLVGQLNEADIDRVADHLETCPACRKTVETLEVKENTLADRLRVPAAARPFPISAACERAMAAAEKLLDDSSPSEKTETTLVTPGVVRIRDYRIVEKLGEGGMGTVYKAIHERLERMVAIKVLTPDRLRDPQGVSRFQREMKAVGKLQHPNIINAHDAGEADGTHFLVMEYVDGVDLGALVTRLGPLSIADACELIRQAALGLEHVHEHGLVHRDIKPSNLMLTTTGQVKILDLGLALLHDPQQPVGGELTATSQLMGTADYISPEQAEHTHGVDIRADLYSLGCTLYKLLAGHAPFSGKEFDTPLKKIVAHLQRTPPAIASQRAGVPAGLVAVIDKLLAKEPASRYTTPAEVAAALAPFASGCDVARLAARAASHPDEGRVGGAAPREPHPAPATGAPDGTTKVSLSSPLAETDGGTKRKPRTARRKWWRDRRVQIAAGGLAAMLVLYGIVISIQTPAGTIVLTMDQPEIAGAEVTVDGQNKMRIRTGIDDEPIEVAADEKEHLLEVSMGGFQTFTQAFTVRKGKNPPIHVQLVPDKKVAVAGSKPSSEKADWHGWPADAPPPAIAPFNADEARQHQEAWAKYLGVRVEYTNSIGMKFRLIPPGEFVMGRKAEMLKRALENLSPEWESWRPNNISEGPQHRVVLTQPVYIGLHEVTQGDFQTVMGRNPSHFVATGPVKERAEKVAGLDTSSHPVENVSWNDAAEFCAKLCEKENLQPSYARAGETVTELKGTGYRLPTEAEWECACRAGTTTKWWSGEHIGELTAVAWMKWNSDGRTHVVGELPANPFGLCDVYGNVWEWVHDRWEQAYYEQFAKTPAIDPRGPESGNLLRVIRGSAWCDTAANSSNKAGAAPRTQRGGWGFRVALSVDAGRQAVKDAAPPIAPSEPDQVVDLLKLVDVNRDAVKGKWTLSPNGLASDGSVPYCRLKLPYALPPEYDFRIEFTAQGGNDILQLLTAGGRSFTWLMGAWGGRYDGFDTVKDHPLTREGTNIIGGPTSVRRGQRHTSVIQVRRDSLSATIDGKFVVRHATDGSDLGMPGEWSIGEGLIGLGTTFDAVVFHKVELVVPAATDRGAGWHGWPANAPNPAIVPFDADQAKTHQEAWATYLKVPVDSENSLGMKFRLIPPGKFVMGRSPRDTEVFHNEKLADDDLPPHEVTLTQPFAIGVTEVTQRQWKELMGTTPWLSQKMAVDDESRPATYVSWFDADKFCRRLSERTGEPYRLPTEAEWEFACRAGTTTAFSSGDSVGDLDNYAWMRRNSHDLPQAVATKKPNPWGLFDMHGNAWEWCDTRFSPYTSAAVVDPQSEGEGRFRPLRGGCFWSVPANDYRSAVRRRWPEGLGYPESGFRVVRGIRKGP